jgi:ATP-dependent DNA helicase DinG
LNAAELAGVGWAPWPSQVPGFAPRLSQQQMAEAVASTLSGGGTLIVEAGTGTGKTYAYLVPALLAGARVIISTGTRHLQDQLYQQDLPVVRRALDMSRRGWRC